MNGYIDESIQIDGVLLTVDYWRNIQAKHRAGEVSVVVPYFRPALPEGREEKMKSA